METSTDQPNFEAQIKAFNAIPKAVSIVQAHGLSVRDYSLTTMAINIALMPQVPEALRPAKSKQAEDPLEVAASPEHVQFVQTHRAEITKWMNTIRPRARKGNRRGSDVVFESPARWSLAGGPWGESQRQFSSGGNQVMRIQTNSTILALTMCAGFQSVSMSAHAADGCQPVFDAFIKVATTPNHSYTTSTAVSGSTPTESETIIANGQKYIRAHGKWMRIPVTSQDVV